MSAWLIFFIIVVIISLLDILTGSNTHPESLKWVWYINFINLPLSLFIIISEIKNR